MVHPLQTAWQMYPANVQTITYEANIYAQKKQGLKQH